jgi:hypothetical protein
MNFVYFFENTKWFGQIASIITILTLPCVFVKLIIYKAKHKIYFDPKETYHERQLSNCEGQPQSVWLHLMVKNKGFELSKKAEAYISEIWEKENNNYKKLSDFNSPVKLKWAHEAKIEPVDIFPREKRRLDVCYICQNQKKLHLAAYGGFPSGSIKNIIDFGDYLFVIKVVSENSLTPAQFILRVEWDGEWKTITGEKYVKSFRSYKNPVKSFSLY